MGLPNPSETATRKKTKALHKFVHGVYASEHPKDHAIRRLKIGKPLKDPSLLTPEEKEAEELERLNEKQKMLRNEKDKFIPTSFPPRPPPVLATSLRGTSAEQYLIECILSERTPDWLVEPSKEQIDIFDRLCSKLEDPTTRNVDELHKILKLFDVAITRKEIAEALEKMEERSPNRVDPCEFLFSLVNSQSYVQRIKKDERLYSQQMKGYYTKRQVAFYSLISAATFYPEPEDVRFERIKHKFIPHSLRYHMAYQRLSGLSRRQLIEKAHQLEEITSQYRRKVASPYAAVLIKPVEPELLRQQREIKERRKITNFSENPVVESKASAEEKGFSLSAHIEEMAQKAYITTMAKPVRKYPPEDWLHHRIHFGAIPLPQVTVPKAILQLFKKFDLTILDVKTVRQLVRMSLEKYYDKVKEVAIEQSLRHWISTYSDFYKQNEMTEDMALQHFQKLSMNVPNDGNQQRENEGFQAVMDHVINSKIDAGVWLSRLGTVIFSVFSLIALIFGNPWGCCKRALLCNAASCSLCLHQNLQNVHFSEDFFNVLLMDDFFHYLLFSLTFLFSQHSVLILLPLALYNLCHSAQYSMEVLNKLGEGSSSVARFFRSIPERYESEILKVVAWTEVIIMPLSLVMLITGYGTLWEPFMYYHFLSLRYAARTGSYTREVFHELKIAVESYANSPTLPDFIRQFLHNMVSVISQLSPMVPSL